MLAAILGLAASSAFAQVSGLEFTDEAACRMNEIPLGQPARIEAKRDGRAVQVKVAANFGCQTTAGRPRIEQRGGEIRLYADTLLPDHPTPACKCTRTLNYRFAPKSPESTPIVFLKDGQVEGRGQLEP